MNFLCKIVLGTFFIFLVTPTVVSLIDNKVNISFFYNLSEEENHCIEFFDSFRGAMDFNDSKLLGLHNIKLSASLKKDLQQLVCIDFISLQKEEYSENST